MLAAGHPERMSDEALAQELKDAIPYDMRESHGSADDLAHGRRLARRTLDPARRRRLSSRCVTDCRCRRACSTPTHPTGSAGGTTVAHIRHRQAELRSIERDVPGTRSCSNGGPRWPRSRGPTWIRAESTSADSATHYNSRYDTPSFWSGQGGALAFEMFRLDKGATEVYLQVATSRKFAVRCGATTHQQCLSFQSMDGNSYLLTDSTLAGGGIEVQYSPSGEEVITVIARNTQRGQILDDQPTAT